MIERVQQRTLVLDDDFVKGSCGATARVVMVVKCISFGTKIQEKMTRCTKTQGRAHQARMRYTAYDNNPEKNKYFWSKWHADTSGRLGKPLEMRV
jgi:hypothetical protein